MAIGLPQLYWRPTMPPVSLPETETSLPQLVKLALSACPAMPPASPVPLTEPCTTRFFTSAKSVADAPLT